MSERYVPRVSVEVTHEMHRKLQTTFPHGMLRAVVVALLQMTLSLVATHGVEALYRIVDGRARLSITSNETLVDDDSK